MSQQPAALTEAERMRRRMAAIDRKWAASAARETRRQEFVARRGEGRMLARIRRALALCGDGDGGDE